jgi:hypothetical protein
MEHLDHPGLLRSPPVGLGRLLRSHVPGLLARSLAPSPPKPRSGEKAGGAFVCELPMGRAEVLSISGSVNVLGSPDGLGHQTSQQGGCTSVRPRETCPNGPMGIRTCGVDVILRPLAPGTSSRYGSPLKIISLWQIEHVTARERTNAARMLQRFSSAATTSLRSGNVVVEHHSYAGLDGLGNLGGHLLGEFGEFFGLRDHRIELLARMCGRQCNELQR